MPTATVLLLETARANRAQAQRARRLASEIILPQDDGERLTHYAQELEQRALEMEARAVALAETIARTRQLSAQLHELIEEARERVHESRAARLSGAGSP